MENRVRDRLHKKDIFTIPNFLSFFRILLIPVMVVLYSKYNQYIAAVFVIVLSGITDILDGKIARKFNMISDFGKFIDPVADKLTQLFMIICLVSKYPGMIGLIILMVVKESFLLLISFITFKKTGEVNGAKWYGKVTTLVLYAVMVLLFLFPNIPPALASALITVCYVVIFGSMVLYTRMFLLSLKDAKKASGEHTANA